MEGANPENNWTRVFCTASAVADERTGGAGSQALEVVRNDAAQTSSTVLQAVGTTPAQWYLYRAWLKNGTARYVTGRISDATEIWSLDQQAATEWGCRETLARAAGNTLSAWVTITTDADAETGRVDDVQLYPITLRPHVTMPSANHAFDVLLAPPVAPYPGQRLLMAYRVQGELDTELNCFVAELVRNTSSLDTNWDFNLWRYDDGEATLLYANSDVGAPAGLKAVVYGTQHQVYMYADSTWAPLCPVQDVDYLTEAVGANLVYSPDITITGLTGTLADDFDAGLTGEQIVFIDGDSKSDSSVAMGAWDFIFDYIVEQRTGSNWTIYNVAVGGKTLYSLTDGIASNLAALPDTPAPDCALINIGANDVANLGTEEYCKGKLRTYVEAINAKWATTPIYFMRPWYGAYEAACDTLAGYLSDIAGEYAYVNLGPDERVFIKGDDNGASTTMLPQPNAHPNGWGRRLAALEWADLIAPVE